jgi:hypothetical protein
MNTPPSQTAINSASYPTQVERIEGETRYSLYHSSFRNWLSQQLNAA